MSSLDKKRVMPTLSSNSKKAKTPTLQSNVIELQGLLHAMEKNNEGKDMMEQAIAFRVERCQSLWSQVSDELKHVDPERWNSLQQQVQRACQGGPPMVPIHPTIQRIFLEPGSLPKMTTPAIEIERIDNDDDDDDTEPSSEQVIPESAPTRNKSVVPVNVQDMQKQQQEQIQEAVSQMASKLKEETARIHSTLQQQTGKLDEMEDLVTENVSNVTDLAKDVQEHVSKGWTKIIGTWTMLFTVVGAFLFSMVTISMVPKREGACLFFCKKTEDQFCRVLPGGRKECIQVEKAKAETEFVEEQNQKGECTVGMNGECIVAGSTAKDEKSRKPPNSDKQQRKAKSPSNVFAEEAVIDEIDPNIPLYNGRPFAGKEVRKAAASGDLQALSSMMAIKPDFIDAQDSNEWTALHLASRAGHTQVAQYLVDAGCNTQLKTASGESSLSVAIRTLGDNHDIVRLLAALPGAEPIVRGRIFTEQDLRLAAQQGNLQMLKEMGTVKREWLEAQDENGWAAIHQAARGGHVEIVEYLLDLNCDSKLLTKSGSTAMDIATNLYGENSPVVTILMDIEQS